MDNTKFTKGKWELTDRGRGIEVLIKQSTYKSICTTTGNTKWQYDMLLISKAPEILKELVNEVEILKAMGLGDTERCKRKERLIKQATEL